MTAKMRERALLYRLEVHRDPDAFTELYDIYAPRIYRYVFFKVKSQEDAEDLTADVFLRAWHHITEEREIHNFHALLYTVARNVVVDYYRARKGKTEEELDLDLVEDIKTTSLLAGSAHEEIESKELEQELLKSMGKLKDEYREILTMRYIDGMSLNEIAELMGKSAVGVRVLQHRAIKALQRIMENGNGKRKL